MSFKTFKLYNLYLNNSHIKKMFDQINWCDPSLFVYSHHEITLYASVYADDILIIGSSSSMVHKLRLKFSLKHLDKFDYFMGIKVKHLKNGCMCLIQFKYI